MIEGMTLESGGLRRTEDVAQSLMTPQSLKVEKDGSLSLDSSLILFGQGSFVDPPGLTPGHVLSLQAQGDEKTSTCT
jgi:hypothetical protein